MFASCRARTMPRNSCTWPPGSGLADVRVVRGEEADRVVTPVVRQALLGEAVVGDELMHGQQFDRGHAELGEVLDDHRVREARVGAAHRLGDERVVLRHALDVRLVNDRLVVRRPGRTVVAPVEVRVDDQGVRHVTCRVIVVALVGGVEPVAEQRLGPVDAVRDRLRVRVDEQLVRVAAQAALGVVRAVHAVAVALAGADAQQVAVVDEAVHLLEADPRSTPSASNRHSSTWSAASEKSAKLVPIPS